MKECLSIVELGTCFKYPYENKPTNLIDSFVNLKFPKGIFAFTINSVYSKFGQINLSHSVKC